MLKIYLAAIRENGGVPPPNMGGFPGMMGGMSPIGIGYAGFRPSTATGGPQAALANPQAGQKDKSRPVTSNAVAGTPWCVVWTGDNRVSLSFFKYYNMFNYLNKFKFLGIFLQS